jgi:FkbM family methyltransferase
MDGMYESDVTNFLIKNIRPESICVDVGANFGYYTCMMARLAAKGRTLGIEAAPLTFELARDNIFINWLERVASVLNVAASNEQGSLTLYRRQTRSGNTSIARLSDDYLESLGEEVLPPITVEAKPLDKICSGPIDFMKIDVEGSEPLVFRGAKGVFAKSQNIQIVMEWSPGQIAAAGFDVAAFTEELSALGLVAGLLDDDGNATMISWADVRSKAYANLLLTVSRLE